MYVQNIAAVVSISENDVHRYVIIIKLLDSTFNTRWDPNRIPKISLNRQIFSSRMFRLVTSPFLTVPAHTQFLYISARRRDSPVGIATSYVLDDRGVGDRVPVGSRIFLPPRRPDRF
jgi:hypothetical protein